MFSATMIASSTSMPITRIMPNMVIMLIVTPMMLMTSTAIRKAKGIPSAVTSATRTFSSNGRASSTSTRPASPLPRSTLSRRLIR